MDLVIYDASGDVLISEKNLYESLFFPEKLKAYIHSIYKYIISASSLQEGINYQLIELFKELNNFVF